jgi:hypothetical protein
MQGPGSLQLSALLLSNMGGHEATSLDDEAAVAFLVRIGYRKRAKARVPTKTAA